MSRRRLIPAVVTVLVLAGLSAGLLVGRSSGADRLSGKPGVLASGRFHSLEWATAGRASVVRKADGSLRLTLRGFSTQKAPELWVVLQSTRDGSRRQLAPLASAYGNQSYALPASLATNLAQRVIIFCTKCGKPWGEATLRSSAA